MTNITSTIFLCSQCGHVATGWFNVSDISMGSALEERKCDLIPPTLSGAFWNEDVRMEDQAWVLNQKVEAKC